MNLGSNEGADIAARPATPPATILKAVLWMLVAVASFTLVAISGRIAAQSLTPMNIMVYRGWLGLALLCGVLMLQRRGPIPPRTPQFGLHVVRGSIHFLAQYTWFSALPLITLAQLTAIEFTAPLWTALLAPLFLGEHLSRTRLIAAFIGFVGVMAVVRPVGFQIDEGSLFAFAAAICFACNFIATKKLTRRDPALTILFYMTFIQTVVASVLVIPTLQMPDTNTMLGLLLLTVSGLAAQFALARAFALADAIVVAPMDFLRLPLIAIVGVLLYAEPLDPWLLAGGLLVLVGNFVNILGERRRPL